MTCCFGCVLCFHENLTRAMFLKYKAFIETQLLRFCFILCFVVVVVFGF